MRNVVRRLINHLFYLSFWLFLGGALLIGVIYLLFSNVINFSDSWNAVHPSLPVVNDVFFKEIISIIRSIEINLGLGRHISNLLGNFDYGHGYAIAQSIGTLIIETIMTWSLWLFIQARHREQAATEQISAMRQSRQYDDADLLNMEMQNRLNSSAEKRRFLSIFIIFGSLTVLIWFFDFYLTYAKQVIVSKDAERFALLGPFGTVLLMTIISVGFAFITEELRREILQVVGDLSELILGPSQEQRALPTEQTKKIEPGNVPTEGPPPPPLDDEMVTIHSIEGILYTLLIEINAQWQRGEISIDGQVYAGDGRLLTVTELFQVMNPPEGMPVQCYYTEDGINSLDNTTYYMDENRVVIFN